MVTNIISAYESDHNGSTIVVAIGYNEYFIYGKAFSKANVARNLIKAVMDKRQINEAHWLRQQGYINT